MIKRKRKDITKEIISLSFEEMIKQVQNAKPQTAKQWAETQEILKEMGADAPFGFFVTSKKKGK